MFELGKKDGSDRDIDSGTDNRPESGPTSIRSASAPSDATRREVAVIGRSIRINGDLLGDEDLRIEGDVNGTVRLHNNTLTIGSEGKIRADVYAKAVIVEGSMEGDLFSSERVAIHKTATVHGNITAPRVSLEDGARFKGSIEMDPEAVQAALGKTDSVAKAAVKSSTHKSKANGSKPPANQKVVTDEDASLRESVG